MQQVRWSQMHSQQIHIAWAISVRYTRTALKYLATLCTHHTTHKEILQWTIDNHDLVCLNRKSLRFSGFFFFIWFWVSTEIYYHTSCRARITGWHGLDFISYWTRSSEFLVKLFPYFPLPANTLTVHLAIIIWTTTKLKMKPLNDRVCWTGSLHIHFSSYSILIVHFQFNCNRIGHTNEWWNKTTTKTEEIFAEIRTKTSYIIIIPYA